VSAAMDVPEGCKTECHGETTDERIVFVVNKVPHHEMLMAAVLPRIKLVWVDYWGGRGSDVTEADDNDMRRMAGDMFGAIGPTYKSCGIIDAGGLEGFSSLVGHMVPADMMGSTPGRAPNFVKLINFVADHYLRALSPGRSVADGPYYDADLAATNPPLGEPQGEIDLLGCPRVPVAAMSQMRPDVAKFTCGPEMCERYFEAKQLQKWKDAVMGDKDRFIFAGTSQSAAPARLPKAGFAFYEGIVIEPAPPQPSTPYQQYLETTRRYRLAVAAVQQQQLKVG